ncbi:sarcosine oxidase subunit delta [Fulvimarina sp. MAC3]|uniref:sarcosine oxidase subunit delta n=1 Tax=Fulvimarina sp. MAC3 TaxID=3148887 RepID=UPI0031FD4076
MLLIRCPYCGNRPETEFHGGGEAHIERPENPSEMTDQDWAEFLYYRTNPKGMHAERWQHRHGCGRWFNALRDTVTDQFAATYEMGMPRPDLAASSDSVRTA